MLCSGWERRATFSLRVLHKSDPLRDQNSDEQTFAFTANQTDWGFRYFIHPEDLPEFLAEDTLRVQVSVTVTPPTADIDAACRLWAFGAASKRSLELLLPSMIGNLQHALAATDARHEWSLCPSCGARLRRPPAPRRPRRRGCGAPRRGARAAQWAPRTRCCASLCRARRPPSASGGGCRGRCMPPARSEDLATTTVSQKLKEVLSSDGLRNKLVAQFENDLKAVL